jgi:hypothetical protein
MRLSYEGDTDMVSEMISIAADCLKEPNRQSVWSPQLNRYVCPDSAEGRKALIAAQTVPVTPKMRRQAERHPPINPEFKLVFLTAAGGTLLFAILCITLTFLIGKEPKPLFEKVVMGMFDLTKIGFGAVVGILGGKTLQRDVPKRLEDTTAA